MPLYMRPEDRCPWYETFFDRLHPTHHAQHTCTRVAQSNVFLQDTMTRPPRKRSSSKSCFAPLQLRRRWAFECAACRCVVNASFAAALACGRSLATRVQYWQNEQRSYVVRDKLWGCKLKENTMQVCINTSLHTTPHQHADCTFRARWCNFWITGTVFDSL
jgi:hypothetical protein